MIEKRTGTFKSFDGTPVYYEARGKGRPIVFAYGIVCTANHWRHQLKYFSENYTTIYLDYRGHQKTPAPDNRDNLTVDALAEDFKGLLDHLEIEKAAFCGHSFGAQVLVRAFDRFPEIFENLIFINGFASNPLAANLGGELGSSLFKLFKDGYQQLPQTLSYLWKMTAGNPISMQISAMAGGFNLNLTSVKDLEIYGKGVETVDLDVFLALFDQMLTYNGTHVLDRINVPTLIMGGSKDSVTPVSFQETLHKKIKGSELVIVPYGSHCTQLDLPDFVNLKIEKFFREHSYI